MNSKSQKLARRCRFHTFAVIVTSIVTAAGCGSSSDDEPSVKTEDFQTLLDTSMNELRLKTEAHKAWGMGTFDRWDLDQNVGDLIFSNADGYRVTAPAQIIGSFSSNDNSWLWAWDNPSILDHMKVDAKTVRQYGLKHNIPKLTERKWTGTEDDAWEMAALAMKLCNAQGVYRGSSTNSAIFFTFGAVKIEGVKEDGS